VSLRATTSTYSFSNASLNTSFVAGTRSGTLNLSATSITTVIPASTGDLTSNPLKFNVNATLGTASFILAVDAVIPVVTSSTGTYLSGKLKITGTTGTLYLSFLGGGSVKLELDSNNDGVIDSSKPPPSRHSRSPDKGRLVQNPP